MCRFIVWYQIWRLISGLYNPPPPLDPWTCSFVCCFNCTDSIQSCSHFGVLNLSYTLPSLSYHLLIHASFNSVKHVKVKYFSRGHKLWNNVAALRGERETLHLSENLPQSGIEPVWQAVAITKPHAQNIAFRAPKSRTFVATGLLSSAHP